MLAVSGYGLWALVGGQIAQFLITGVLLILTSRRTSWRRPSITALSGLLRFGSGLTAARIGSYISLNVDSVIAGRLLGPTYLGFYSRAYFFLQQPTMIFGSMADRVLYPAFSSIQRDGARIVKAFNTVTALVFIVLGPLSGLLVVAAPEIINALLGRQWHDAVLPFQSLIVALPFRVASKMQGTVLRSLGRVYVQALREWSCAALILVGACAGALSDNLRGLSIGVALALIINYYFGAVSVKRVAGISVTSQIKVLWRPTLVSVSTFGAIAWMAAAGGFAADSKAHLAVALVACVAYLIVIGFAPSIFGVSGRLLHQLALSRLARGTGAIRE